MNGVSLGNVDLGTAYRRFRVSIWLTMVLALPLSAPAATYFVDNSASGDDGNDGVSQDAPIQTVARANTINLAPGDTILFKRGGNFEGTLSLTVDGNSAERIRVGAWGTGDDPVLYGLDISGDYVVVEDLVIDHRKDDSDAVRLRSARNVTFRRMIIRNGTRDAIDLDQSDGLLVEDIEIHHFLNGSLGSEDDSHGLAITNTNGVTVRRANIHHVSGDSVQADPNRRPGQIATNILIEESKLWTGPLLEDFNDGWAAGDSPGENAIDTKVLQSGFEDEVRMRIKLKDVVAHGWTAVPEISNRAAFNLKEKIAAELDRVSVYNSEIAFRIRGGLGNADTIITNAVVYDVATAIRAEDNLNNLQIYNTTFGEEVSTFLDLAGGDAGMATWDWRNNAFLGRKPVVATDASNIAAVASDFTDVAQHDYRLSVNSRLIDTGEAIDAVVYDRVGKLRTRPFDAGAYEGPATARKPEPPTNLGFR